MHKSVLSVFPRVASAIALFAMLLPNMAFAQHHDHAAMAMPASGAGLGHLTFPTSTKSPEAQAAFERGMLWLHLYEDDHATEEFQKAEKLDPGFALAYWGEALTHTRGVWNIDDAEGGRAVLAKLGPTREARMAKAPTAREKAFLDAAEQMFGPGTVAERDARFLAAAEALAKAYPGDDEALLLHASALLSSCRGKRDETKYLQAAEISKRVLTRNSQHPGAAHYWIHAMDDPAHADAALPAARALAKIAPAAGHAQHMTSHIFLALGMWDDVITANEEAMRVENTQRKEMSMPLGECGHYDEWLQYAYYQAGRHRDGQKQLAACAREGGEMVAWVLVRPHAPGKTAEMLLQYAQGQQLSLMNMRGTSVAESPVDRLFDGGIRVDTSGFGRAAGWDAFTRGYSALLAADLTAARRELAVLKAAALVPESDLDRMIGDREGAYLAIMSGMLEGGIAVREGRVDEGLALLDKAATRYEAVPFDFGPPVPVKPPREFAGELLLEQHRPKDALVAFDAALKMAPRRALSVLGRARALKAVGDAAGAAKAYADLVTQWHAADGDLPMLAEVRQNVVTSH